MELQNSRLTLAWCGLLVAGLMSVTNEAASADQWSGLYLGAHIGYAEGSADYEVYNSTRTFLLDTIELDPSGAIFGLQAGYDFRIDHFVIGVAADFSKTGVEHSHVEPVGAVFAGQAFSMEIDSMATVRARLGIVLNESWMVYGTAGFATADISHGVSGAFVGQPFSFEIDDDFNGWVIGAGIEHALTENAVLGVEYRHVDFGSNEYGTIVGPVATLLPHNFDPSIDEVRATVNWGF